MGKTRGFLTWPFNHLDQFPDVSRRTLGVQVTPIALRPSIHSSPNSENSHWPHPLFAVNLKPQIKPTAVFGHKWGWSYYKWGIFWIYFMLFISDLYADWNGAGHPINGVIFWLNGKGHCVDLIENRDGASKRQLSCFETQIIMVSGRCIGLVNKVYKPTYNYGAILNLLQGGVPYLIWWM